MKLRFEKTPYSSIVGGGMMLVDEKGIARFMVHVSGTSQGITKEEDAAICEAVMTHCPQFAIPDRK
jgi:ferredoxin